MPILANFSFNPSHLLVLAILVLLGWTIYLEWRLSRLMKGKSGTSLEDNFAELDATVRETNKVNEEIQVHLIKMEERLQKSIQHVKTVRFNPFPEQGGNHSFATALLNEHGDGAVLSTLYSRDKTSFFAKPIKNGTSEFELSQEEKQAIAK